MQDTTAIKVRGDDVVPEDRPDLIYEGTLRINSGHQGAAPAPNGIHAEDWDPL